MDEGKDRKRDRNLLGFTDKQLGVILDFYRKFSEDPRISFGKFHRKDSPYSRKQSTIDLLNKAYKEYVLIGPYIYCNSGIDVTLLKTNKKPSKLLNEAKKSKEVTFAMTLKGDWSFLCLKRGRCSLNHVSTITPNFLSRNRIEELMFDEPGKLPSDPFPTGWDELDWDIYNRMGAPREVTFVDIGKQLEKPWKTIQNRFNKIKKSCKSLAYFLPLGYYGYEHLFITFETEYEIGLAHALRGLDHSSYIEKYNDTILLTLFVPPGPLSSNRASERFQDLEEMGIIHDLRVSIPTKWWKPNYDFPK